MQIVIDIPEEAYKQIMEFGFLENTHGKICYKAIKNGTVLPKHGRLIDADKFANDEYLEKRYGTDFYWEFRKRLDMQPIILGANKTGK